ncbi:carbohydrate ABC transporter permease [Tuanshanicoccus lijuaniae]|uniref:carbohydrate ABC transporter permease n=1 Tax=Aerococcaceae bacterium zg-1292 TaxID=2774330 RepID=UPI001BD855B8|nr:carbohydrate ABC transporter permease [Aerococcaceae bacterium zg-A91]MBS4457903.1 carbohydrate ABC transporter permease [Aerococcaceae bacterium zg-BR33]
MKARKIAVFTALVAGLLLIFVPMYLTLTSSFKETAQISGDFFGLPNPFTLSNFERVLKDGLSTHFINSGIITVVSIALIILVIPMAGYALVRHMQRKKSYQLIYTLLIIGIFVPFQVIMLPLTNLMGKLNLSNIPGLIILYLTFAIPQTLFLYTGYIRSVVPAELDEAASIDGCNPIQTYFKIIFPVLIPMHATVLIINALWIWNDFLLPLLMLNRNKDSWTLPLFQYNYQGQYFSDFGPSFASYVIGIVAILVVYLIFQRNIISGMANGAIK